MYLSGGMRGDKFCICGGVTHFCTVDGVTNFVCVEGVPHFCICQRVCGLQILDLSEIDKFSIYWELQKTNLNLVARSRFFKFHEII